jgi:hypothetical protein
VEKILTLHKIATTVELFIYGTAEPAAAIMAASIPALRALVQRETKRKPLLFVQLSDKHLASPAPSFQIITPK